MSISTLCLLLDQSSLLEGLKSHHVLQSLKVEGNPVMAESHILRAISSVLPTLCSIDGSSVTPKRSLQPTEFQRMCKKQLTACNHLQNAFLKALR